jgi:hypothetical protein
VAVWTFKTLHEVTSGGIPDANTLIKRSSCDEFGVRGDGNSSDTILDAEGKDALASFDIPETDSTITATGSNGATITSEIERVNILLVTSECIPDSSRGNIPNLVLLAIFIQLIPMGTYSNQLVLSTSGKVSSIWAETNTSNVKVTDRVHRLILENTDLLSRDDIEDLSRSVAASGNILSIVAESNTANNTLMLKSVDKINIQHTRNLWVENCEPIRFNLLLVGR